ncbi:HEAT repeat domain-containing protein [Rhodococcus sp. SGAir0479]|uniref:HEAT repeat domain-containing protein n=1 Tax=Rhodococcus sp. SGAir0479 TaxID=2567884 RepID=UPI0010CD5FE8|nr:HEAT repeat domain-containing protein [Rhodococcus sp. SGAir0479]QCQ89864.1 HEAT repeat domain-containing protein [Rhodococcus sp. SGAir0479]
MESTHPIAPDARLADALAAPDPSTRLRAALEAGTARAVDLTETLVARCADEPDFYVRDMLTWALCRLPADVTVPRLVHELRTDVAQARSQALHTLSKIGDGRAWPAVSALLHDTDDDVARAAWRAAVALVPPGEEAALAVDLAAEFGRGDRHVQLSLSRALVGLGEALLPVVEAARTHHDATVRAHADATERLHLDPDSGFTLSVEMATRTAVAGPDT